MLVPEVVELLKDVLAVPVGRTGVLVGAVVEFVYFVVFQPDMEVQVAATEEAPDKPPLLPPPTMLAPALNRLDHSLAPTPVMAEHSGGSVVAGQTVIVLVVVRVTTLA